MFTKSLLAFGVVVAMSFSASGAFARDFDHRGWQRAE